MHNLTFFFIATLLLALTPGQDFIYIMVRSVSQGARAGIIAISGLIPNPQIENTTIAQAFDSIEHPKNTRLTYG